MYEIPVDTMTPEFMSCWRAAATHLDDQIPGGIRTWIKAHPYPPFLEHLSFRFGNQLFFIRVEDASGTLRGPGTHRGLLTIAERSHGHACLLPMTRDYPNGTWRAQCPGWGLLDTVTRQPIDPAKLVTDIHVEMTPWELQDVAVQVVRDFIEREGGHVTSWQCDPAIDPAIWFVADNQEPEWVVVRVVRYPVSAAPRPGNWMSIARSCAKLGKTGHFASVSLVSTDQPFADDDEPPVPLYRGHGVYANFIGLE